MEQKITFKKNRKKMPYVLHLTLFLFVLGAICSLLLSIVNFYTKGIINKNEQEQLRQTLEEVGLYDFKTMTNDYQLIDGVVEIYEGKSKAGKALIATLVEKDNRYVTIKSLIVLAKEEGIVENIKVIGNSTSHNMNDQFNQDFGIIGSTSKDYADKFQIVSGATVSSNTIKESIDIAFKQLNIINGEPLDEYAQVLESLGLNNYQVVSDNYDQVSGSVAIYEGENQEGVALLALVTESANPYMTIKSVVVMTKATGIIENIKVISRATSYDESLGYEDKFNQTFGVIGSNQDNYGENFEIVAGATTSSNNVKECIKIAFDQFASMRRND